MNRCLWIVPLLPVALLASACGATTSPAASSSAAAPPTTTESPTPSEATPAQSAAPVTTATTASVEAPSAEPSAKLCGKTVPVMFGLRKDGLFYFDVDVKERKEGCTGFTVELGDKIEENKPFTKNDATAHAQKADGSPDNASITGSFTIVVKSFKPTTDWKKPGKCSGEITASSTDKKYSADITSRWESECWVPK